jgi:hypothetical protein
VREIDREMERGREGRRGKRDLQSNKVKEHINLERMVREIDR